MAGNKIVSCSCVVLLISMMIINVNAGLVLGTRINNINIRKILAVASRAEQAYNAGDLDTLVSLYTEDCRIFFPQRPEQRGQEVVRASYQGIMNAGVQSLSLNTTEIFRMGFYYYRSGVVTFLDRNNTTLNTLNFITIFRKDNGEWRYFVDMANIRGSP